jgi:simple sugar transport system ATP-binding protein
VTPPALELAGITKRYPGVVACDGIDLRCGRGRVHAVVGENGAGKTTLFQIAAGLVTPDAGRVAIGGQPLRRGGAAQARRLGLGMVQQHFLLVPTLTVADNVVLGREPGRGPLYDRAGAAARVAATAARWGLRLDPGARVGDLSVGEQQRVEIVRVLDAGARVLVLDEPTAVLTPQETDDLLRILRALAATDHAVVLVSHRLQEVLAVADDITVLRAGRVVTTMPRAAASEADLASAIVGRPLAAPPPRRPAAPGDVVLELRDAATAGVRGALHGASLAVRSGEILGVAGVEGNGQHALLRAVLGIEPLVGGAVLLDGRDAGHLDVAARRRLGIAYVSDDRLGEGLVASFDLAENLLLAAPRADALGWRGWLHPARWRPRAAAELEAGGVRPSDPRLVAATLSGGNQQKLVLARELAATTRLLVLGQPTRGVDVGGIEFLHARIRAARDAGTAVLLVSADLSEILALADRVVVLFAGRLRGPLPIETATATALGRLMTGAEDAA